MAQTLSFTHNPVSGLYEAEFQIEKAAVLHVERAVAGRLKLGVRTTGAGKYALVDEFEGQDYKSTIDAELMGEIYPKWVKVSSESEPTYGEVVSDGEVAEIKSQSKEVEVTANGTMDITPDAGFSYLNSVKVKTNVAQSGGGSGSASSFEYLDVSGLENESYFPSLIQASIYMKGKISSGQMKGIEITGVNMSMFAMMSSKITDINSVCIDFTSIISQKMGGEVYTTTVEDVLVSGGSVTKEQLNAIPRITESEFYNLNA